MILFCSTTSLKVWYLTCDRSHSLATLSFTASLPRLECQWDDLYPPQSTLATSVHRRPNRSFAQAAYFCCRLASSRDLCLKDDCCSSHTEEKSCQGARCSWSQRPFSNFVTVVDSIASSLDEQDNYDNIVSHATHESTGGNEDFNSLYLFYALAPKQSLHFILHTALLGTITSIMSIIVTIYLCQHFEHSFYKSL